MSWRRLTQYLIPCLASFAVAAVQGVGMYHIHTAAEITEGGILGANLLLFHWFGFSPAITSFVLNALCYMFGFCILGRSFILLSFAAAMGYSFGYGMSEQFPFIWPQIISYPLIASLLGGTVVGVCTGICVRIGGAASGDDALAMSVAYKMRIPIQWIYLISDLLVLSLSLTYIPVQRIAYSLLSVILSGQIIGVIQRKT